MCSESQALDDLEQKIDQVLALVERDFPLCLQNVATHIVSGIRKYGPIYSTWMYMFESFNSWICKRALNMRYPEASVIETCLVFYWFRFIIGSGKLIPLQNMPAILSEHMDPEEDETESETCSQTTSLCAKSITLKPRSLYLIDINRTTNLCENYVVEKCYIHYE